MGEGRRRGGGRGGDRWERSLTAGSSFPPKRTLEQFQCFNRCPSGYQLEVHEFWDHMDITETQP